MEEFISPHTAPIFRIEVSLRIKGLELEAGLSPMSKMPAAVLPNPMYIFME
jgi:hypothetical protein